jgi:formylglycine-generating enzyme required for sulfatase activity
MRFDTLAWRVRLVIAFALVPCAACSVSSSANGGGGDDAGNGGPEAAADDGGATGEAGASDGAGGGDGEASTGPEPCTSAGAVRPCTAANGAAGAQTCTSGPQGTPVWGTCYSAACDSTAQPQSTEACVPAGSFTMGGLDGTVGSAETDTLPAHMVTIRRRFYVDRYEVAYGDFMSWWNAKPRLTPPDGATVFVTGSGDEVVFKAPSGGLQPPGTDSGSGCVAALATNNAQDPVNCVSRESALAYCMAEGKRLPTEAEWEWVATGQGSGNGYPWGSTAPDCSHAIFQSCTWPQQLGASCTAGDTPIGAVNDLAGDEAEWTLDFFPFGCHASNTCWPSYANDPVNTSDGGHGYAVRGGSYQSTPDQIRARARAGMLSGCSSGMTMGCSDFAGDVGFRCVRDEH